MNRVPQSSPATTMPSLVCTAEADIPELAILKGDRIVVENLGEPGGASILRSPDPETVRAILTHASVSVVPGRRRRQLRPGRALTVLR